MIALLRAWSAFICVLFGLTTVGTGAGRMPRPDQSPASTAVTSVPHVQILEPAEDAFVTGPTRLRAAIDPLPLADSAAFFVDGRQVCAIRTAPFECEWDAGAGIIEHHVRLVVKLRSGGRLVQTMRTRAMVFTETVDVDVVQVSVTVTDDRGRYVKGLPRSAFHIFEDGRPESVTHFYSEDVPLELVVAVDMSSSMQPAVPHLKKALSGFLGAVSSRDTVTLVGFNDEVFPLARKSNDPAERMKAVERLTSWGSTALYDVILQGVDLLGSQMGRKALVVFTDGEDSASLGTIAEAERSLQSGDLALFMIGQGRGVTSDALRKVMERLARPTGGRALFKERIDDLHESFEELLDELSNQYVLGYQPTNAARDDTWRQITVSVDGGYRVRARQGYRASAPLTEQR